MPSSGCSASRSTRRVRALRRLYYCGEWIESHALHVFMLAAPDFLGCESAITLAQKDRAAVERGLRLRKAGNAIITLLGGRSVHPVSACIGGFTRAPRRAELAATACRSRARPRGRPATPSAGFPASIFTTVTWTSNSCRFASPGEYPMNEGRLVSSKGIDSAQDEFAGRLRGAPGAVLQRAARDGEGPRPLPPRSARSREPQLRRARPRRDGGRTGDTRRLAEP